MPFCLTNAALLLCLIIKIATAEWNGNSHHDSASDVNWNHPHAAQALQQQQQQHSLLGYITTSTLHPSDNALQQDHTPQSRQDGSDIGNGRNFDNSDSLSLRTPPPLGSAAAPSQQDISRHHHYNYFNVHRFDPTYYDRTTYPRYPFNVQTPRYGPGYRKDKYGHGYGYSCKQGDDCDQVRAATNNHFPALPAPPHPAPGPAHYSPSQHLGSPYPPDFPLLPSHVSASYPYFNGNNHYPPARFNDLHLRTPSHFFNGRYVHDQEENHNSNSSPSE